MKPENTPTRKINYKHWLLQTIPPLLMLGVLFATESGAALVFLTGFYIFPVLFSVISIIAKLIFFKKRRYYLVRPLLTIVIFFIILSIARWTYQLALEDAINEAKIIQEQCQKQLICPSNPSGWTVDGLRIRKSDLGFWLKYQASYYYNPESFNIRVYQGPDMGDHITGGVDEPFVITRYVDG